MIPTYNEAANVERDRPRGRRRARAGSRPASTGSWSSTTTLPTAPARSPTSSPRSSTSVEVLHRAGKDGLGQAYLAGFARALAGGAELVIEMDADFSHDPAVPRRLLAAAEDADLVLGSRYVPGGGVRDWGLLRRLISRGGGLYARLILRVDVHDLTGGFKCIRREVLEAIDLDSVRAEGYVFQIEVTYRALLAGFRVREVPIVFADRTAGTSKMSTRIAIEAMWLVPRLRRTAAAAIARAAEARAQHVQTP